MAHQLESIFGEGKIFIGVVHLPPLPGSPRWGGDMGRVLEQAQREAQILEGSGANGIIVENFGDAPFRIGRVEPDTVAALTLAVDRVRRVTSVPVGINILRNDAGSALAVAVATGAQFIRVNIHYGVMAADEGLAAGEAYATLRHRQALGAEVKILADVLIKHAVPLGPVDLGLMARETAYRGLADGLIVTGPVTGQPASANDIATVRQAIPDRLLLVGSGIDLDNAYQLLGHANGAIVGTSLKQDDIVSNLLDPERVRRMAEAIHAIP
jgi:uncharacterized protein